MILQLVFVLTLHLQTLRLFISLVLGRFYNSKDKLKFTVEIQEEHAVLQPRRDQKLFSSFIVCFLWQGVGAGPGRRTHAKSYEYSSSKTNFCSV